MVIYDDEDQMNGARTMHLQLMQTKNMKIAKIHMLKSETHCEHMQLPGVNMRRYIYFIFSFDM